MLEDKKDGLGQDLDIKTALCTEYVCIVVHVNLLCMYRCTCQPTVTLITVIMNSVLYVYLFQENKSYGSKKPFAFIL
jgi:hypothetical protein